MPSSPPAGGYLIVIGASAGGVEALLGLMAQLPAGFPAAICVVQHVGANPSLLPELMAHRSALPAVHGEDGQALAPGTIHIAPPDRHMLIDGNMIRLSRGPRENHTRPAIDPLFRSAAASWGPRAIGVILTGYMDDGSAGLAAIKAHGGIAVVQDPASAQEPGMPQSAMDSVAVDHVVVLEAMGALLQRLVQASPDRGSIIGRNGPLGSG